MFILRPLPASLLAVFLFLHSPVQSAELLLKIAHVTAPVMEKYIVRGNGFSTQPPQVLPLLADALSAGVSPDPVAWEDRSRLDRSALIDAQPGPVSPAIAALTAAPGTIIGRQLPAGSSGWSKYIVDLGREGSVGSFLCAMAPEGRRLAYIAVQMAGGPFQLWDIAEPPRFTLEANTAYRVPSSYLLHQLQQPTAREWLGTIMPLTGGVGLLIIRSDAPATAGSDTLLLSYEEPLTAAARNEALRASLILGWEPAARAPAAPQQDNSSWPWRP